MFQTDASFEALRQALLSLFPSDNQENFALRKVERTLLLQLPTDIAAFSVFNSGPQEEFAAAYSEFKRLYRDNHQQWDRLTLSFVVCRTSDRAEDDRFYASLEHDPLFCRKYVLRAFSDVSHQRDELLRLPFLPLPYSGQEGIYRPRSAQDFLQSAGISASLARKLIVAGHRSPEGIATDLREGAESFPDAVKQPDSRRVVLASPRAYSRLVSATVEGFRVYRRSQDFDLNASVVVLYGPNGLGKTSFFDAIDYACTGRIGRLCRHQQRSQTEFSQVATHLDKTPGTGSVVIRGRTDRSDAHRIDWTLKRATGDWSTAWIDGHQHDRKSVLTFLTHANWLDSRPRQQTFESLFRATHLFSQDEQELLVEFRKKSIIPEEFISEMLALQDYSQGLSKVEGVLAELSAQRSEIEQQLGHLQDQSKEIFESLPIIADETPDVPVLTPIEDVVGILRKQLRESGLADSLPPETVSLQTIEEWREVFSARLRATEERLALAMVLRDKIPSYRRLLDEITVTEMKLTETEQEIQVLSDQERELASRIEASQASLQEGQVQRRHWEERRRALRSAVEVMAERTDLRKRVDQLQGELEAQITQRAALDARLAATETALSKATAAQTEVSQAIANQRAEVDALSRLIDGFHQFERDTATLSEIRTSLLNAEENMRDAEQQNNESQRKEYEAKVARESVQPEYERALSQQAELEQLVDSIQTHVHDASCPLCGSAFDSLEALLQRIHQQRSHVAVEQEVTLRYKTLVGAESRAADILRVSTTRLSAAKTTVGDFIRMRDRVQEQIARYREEVFSVLGDRNSEVSEVALIARRSEIVRQLQTLEDTAESISRELKELHNAKAVDSALRDSVNELTVDLERQVLLLTDEITHCAARIRHILESENVSELGIETAIARLSQSIADSLASTEQMQRAKDDDGVKLDDLSRRLKGAYRRRDELLAGLEEYRRSAAEVRSGINSLDLPDDVRAGDVDRVAERFQQETTVIRQAIHEADIIIDALRAREKRLRLAEKRAELDKLKTSISQLEEVLANVQKASVGCSSIEKLLRTERQASIEKHIAAYGPLITNFQQRLRSVYGFGGVQLEARGGEVVVQVEWRNKSVQVPPTDFFSDSQKQILMLSIFLAGGLRQNWSGFAPVLLDDPVTHFDDLNAYGFVELLRGIISSHPDAWQFIISTCEDRLFALMQKKFARVAGGANFYEFLGMSEEGPIVERR